MTRGSSIVLLMGVALGGSCADREPQYACTDEDALALYERRIAPLLEDGAVTSCNDCHLSGVDLGLYVQSTPCATMACMVERGIVDLDAPDDSLVLDWILRADPASPLITADVIDEEHDAVRDWIEYSARCSTKVCEPSPDAACGTATPTFEDCPVPAAGPGNSRRPWDDPGDCSDRTLESMFAETVYSWRGRCFQCHFADNPDPPEGATPWIAVGNCEVASLMTMRNVIREGYVDLVDPTRSLLLLKPLAESAGGVEHGGGDKFHDKEDPAYGDFLAWADRYARCSAEAE